MSIRKHLLSAALIAAGLGACAPQYQGNQAGQPAAKNTTLIVENNNWADMTVYVVISGFRARVGSVASFSQARFVLSEALIGAGAIRLLADPIGSNQAFISDPIHVNPGQQVRFRLENNVRLSSYSVM
jgi:hypothetical protein